MAEFFTRIRLGYKLVTAKLEWNVKMPFLHATENQGSKIDSPCFSTQETEIQWQMMLLNEKKEIAIYVFLCEDNVLPILEPILIKIAILNARGQKIVEQMITTTLNSLLFEEFKFKKENIKSQNQQDDSSHIICCKIFWHVKLTSTSSADSPIVAINCSDGLITQLQGLFDDMKFSDVIFDIRGREFPAHKIILAARSEVFAAMFQHPTTENLTNKIKIEDIEPDVFHELLRFIYTGRINSTTMETMAAGLLIAADKYFLIELKNECEKYLVLQMSPENCVELILHINLLNPAEHLKKVLKEAAKYFRRLQSEVMATAKWEKMEEENPRLLLKIQKILLRKD